METGPRCLAIHLVRSRFERGGGVARVDTRVGFQEMEKWAGGRYSLVGVVTHLGRHDSGHYMCYRRRKRGLKRTPGGGGPDEGTRTSGSDHKRVLTETSGKSPERGGYGNRWWGISDEHVRAVDVTEVLSKQKEAYILFYERMD
jgi:Ubiquitin carboxyl-terminal hydrolase